MKIKLSRLLIAGIVAIGPLVIVHAAGPQTVITDTEGSELTQKALFYYNSPLEEGLQTAFEYAKEAVEKNPNDIVSHRLLGNMYYHGKGVEANHEEALFHYLQGADNDSVSAYMAGKMYLNGEGTAIDIDTGADLVKQAADMGETLAQYELAQLSLDQAEVESNPQMKHNLEKSALHYSKLCAEKKNTGCMTVLGRIFEKGLAGMPVSVDSANQLYEMARK
ncbi:sel1 repeat family protein [Acinetobacter sp. SwsAc5]|uniref:tetratricopeptide repeat protein n=1 Tax=Acinetobacter sp. SwsAc5 TaxID=2749438 RepID=UPI0015C14C64|nr:tetratricopeptide repeat protein [Acinetobacter sp. SwsAc5]NWK51995.1 sel1 repeat family protein [Acinetobacter sp. SwsAc5]